MTENGMKAALDHYGYFTNEALLDRLDRELIADRDRIDRQRSEDRKADGDRLDRIETDIRSMRDMLFEEAAAGI